MRQPYVTLPLLLYHNLYLKKKNHNIKLSEVKKSIKLRNLRDKNRKHSPLLKHRDALEIHTGKLNKKRMIKKMSVYIEKILKNKKYVN